MKIYPIVEGHGEVEAVPVLLRRLLAEAECHSIAIGTPIRRTQSQCRNKTEVQKAVRLARLQPECAAIIMLFDGEDDCPKELGAQVRIWAVEAAGQTPCDVVIAYREYETWFLSAVESLRGKYGIQPHAISPADPEAKRDAKGALEEFMPPNRAYSETGDQPKMTATFDMGLTHQRNRSFRKLTKTVGTFVHRLHAPISVWPPQNW